MLAQREPRGVAFVVATPRPLIDYWRPGSASPFMNIFLNQPLGPMQAEDLAARVAQAIESESGVSDNKGEIIRGCSREMATVGHPLVANFVLQTCLRQPRKAGHIDRDALNRTLADSEGPMVALVRRILAELLPQERQWLTALEDGNRLTPTELRGLRRLAEYGLLPPATVIPAEVES